MNSVLGVLTAANLLVPRPVLLSLAGTVSGWVWGPAWFIRCHVRGSLLGAGTSLSERQGKASVQLKDFIMLLFPPGMQV